MDSAALLDLLGNDNRRRILRLLARKPCYVTEISEYLGVSPKAVIEHLEKLEDAGLVESRVDDRRRKYFHIARNVRLEVNVSPYAFGTKSAYAASKGFDVTRWRHLSIEVDEDPDPDPEAEDGHARADPGPPGTDGEGTRGDAGAAESETEDADAGDLVTDAEGATDADTDDDVSELAGRLREFEELQNELSMAQRWVQGRITDLLDRITDAVDEDPGVDGRLYADVLRSLAGGERSTVELARAAEAPPEIVETALSSMAEAGVVERADDGWRLSG
jgi:ArsR family transcriptional regulator